AATPRMMTSGSPSRTSLLRARLTVRLRPGRDRAWASASDSGAQARDGRRGSRSSKTRTTPWGRRRSELLWKADRTIGLPTVEERPRRPLLPRVSSRYRVASCRYRLALLQLSWDELRLFIFS